MTLSVARVMWPSTMASQMSSGCSPRPAANQVHQPIGTTTCETMEMYSGLRVSPVPCRPPV